MRKTKIFSSLLFATFAFTSISGYAQGRGPGDDDRGRPPMGREDGRGPERDRGPDGGRGFERDRGPESGRGFERERGYDDRPGPGRWHKGERLPREYRERQYVIEDWRAYSLAPPPRGYQWVGVGGDYFLVAIPTGLVFQVVIGR